MIISLALVLLVTAGGTLASYLYDEDAAFAARLCAGACIGIAALGLLGFVFASFLGLTPLAILLALVVSVALPLLSLTNPDRRALVQQDLRQTSRSIRQGFSNPGIQLAYVAFYLVVAAILWRAFQRAMIETPEGIFTGLLNNFGDLPFHLSVITGFSLGNNFPPQDPTYAGVRFTYPFLTDFVSAIFVRCGADHVKALPPPGSCRAPIRRPLENRALTAHRTRTVRISSVGRTFSDLSMLIRLARESFARAASI